MVSWYCQRPIIERYHKYLKSGCGVERLQHRTPETLSAAGGLRGLRDAARDPAPRDQPAAPLAGATAVQALSTWRTGRSDPN
ncbi:hypothetical protein R5W23_005217 [Gemmata sp. JC673]|uniref:Transposase n=1 Tax=Gemmata algarum TaxID=2975278 RepID=A0ABU5F916_9BACT|nr:hypothetical protein [Gemmata algarum]MDY3563603.1 hypothetical protein [Gemmata algarum]